MYEERKKVDIEQILRALKALPQEHEITRKIKSDLFRLSLLSSRTSGITYTTFGPSTAEKKSKLTEDQIDELRQKIKDEVIKQIRSEIFQFIKTQKVMFAEKKIDALSDTLKEISKIPEISEAYLDIENETLKFTIIHESPDRINILNKIIEIENMLDEKFEDLYFDFTVLHCSEISRELISSNLIFKQR
jgi:hypothetical protein